MEKVIDNPTTPSISSQKKKQGSPRKHSLIGACVCKLQAAVSPSGDEGMRIEEGILKAETPLTLAEAICYIQSHPKAVFLSKNKRAVLRLHEENITLLTVNGRSAFTSFHFSKQTQKQWHLQSGKITASITLSASTSPLPPPVSTSCRKVRERAQNPPYLFSRKRYTPHPRDIKATLYILLLLLTLRKHLRKYLRNYLPLSAVSEMILSLPDVWLQ